MTTFSTTSSELLKALGLRLVELDLVQYSEAEDVVYGEDPELPAYVWRELPAEPDTAVSATVTNDARDRDHWNPDYYVRLRVRTAENAAVDADDLADRFFNHLHVPDHYYQPQTWPGGVRVIDVRRVVRAQSATDSNNRLMRADSYRITLNPPGEIS